MTVLLGQHIERHLHPDDHVCGIDALLEQSAEGRAIISGCRSAAARARRQMCVVNRRYAEAAAMELSKRYVSQLSRTYLKTV
jgi:hypothetical protein